LTVVVVAVVVGLIPGAGSMRLLPGEGQELNGALSGCRGLFGVLDDDEDVTIIQHRRWMMDEGRGRLSVDQGACGSGGPCTVRCDAVQRGATSLAAAWCEGGWM